MAINNNATNTTQSKKADAFINLSFKDGNGKTHYLQASERLFEDKILGRSLINKAKADPDFVLQIEGRVHVVGDVSEMEDIPFA